MRTSKDSIDKKLLTESEGGIVVQKVKQLGQKVVFTNGCFDVLHPGHLSYLRAAAELGEVLIIGLNSDASVKRLKGEARPIHNISNRIFQLACLSFVDYIMVFDTDTPLELIKSVNPDILVKGGDYLPNSIVGSDWVLSQGGKVLTIPFIEGHSSSSIIEKLKLGSWRKFL